MSRRILAIILLILAIAVATITPVLAFTPVGTRLLASLSPSPTPTPKPILTVKGTPPPTGATAAYLLDADTGHVLVNVQGSKRLPMASTTKIMTAIIVIETANLDQLVTIRQDALDEVKKYDGSTANLVVGDQIRLKDLLYGLMLPSGDDAAIAIADAVAGTPANFVRAMNNYAHKIHLTQTHYINPDGLTYLTPQNQPDPNHYSSAADLVQLDRVTSEARRVISDSGRYHLVDVASAAGEGVKSRSLRQCNGCEAAIALKLGADQSFVGVVTRISRTEYVVRFQIRDARTGASIIARQSDLRIGADYSWNRGAASLINSGLLDNR